MDELVIGDKKYVSSKQAAKATGYAKDYVGQLCREGRVPARLVGRSWYVLESAIKDHRFGDTKEEPTVNKRDGKEARYESPRYSASTVETLPSINRLNEETEEESEEKKGNQELSERLQETWQAWFDRFEHIAGTPAVEEPALVVEEGQREEKEEEEQKEQEEQVPIRAIYHPQYQPPPEEFLPRRALTEDEEEPKYETRHKARTRRFMFAVQTAGALIALASAVTAVLGSGYLDSYIVSSRQVSQIAGIIFYIR